MERVILVDELDRPIGTEEKLRAHQDGGMLHRAFSVFLFHSNGRMLLQQRARSKYHFGGLWTNACCGHPRPGEDVLAAAERRVFEELRLTVSLVEAATFVYRAADPTSGLTEFEFDHIFRGQTEETPDPDVREVQEYRWKAVADVRRELEDRPDIFTPWFPLALAKLMQVPTVQ